MTGNEFLLSSTQNRHLINLTAVDDNLLEDRVESFTVSLNLDPMVDILASVVSSSVEITINDDDG